MTLLVLRSCASRVMSVWRKRVLSSANNLSTAALALVKASSFTRTARAKRFHIVVLLCRCHESGHDLVGLASLRLNSHVSLEEVGLELRQDFVHGCLGLGEGIELHAHCKRDSTLWFSFAAVMRVVMTLL